MASSFPLSAAAKEFLKNNKTKKIVFTNGCFDILHRGHVAYLQEAKNLGDLLFLGLNADESVRRLKGKDRPINNEDDRKFVLENLKSVDFVEIFREDTPLNLIQSVRPQVLVKGGDWPVHEIVGADFVQSYGGRVQTLSFIDGRSTTLLIESIRKQKI